MRSPLGKRSGSFGEETACSTLCFDQLVKATLTGASISVKFYAQIYAIDVRYREMPSIFSGHWQILCIR